MLVRMSSLQVKAQRSQEENVAEEVGATSSEV